MAKWVKNYNPEPLIRQLNRSVAVDEAGKVHFSGLDFLIAPAHLDAMVKMSVELPEYEKYSLVKQAIWAAGKRSLTKAAIMKELNLLENAYFGAPEKKYVLATGISVHCHRHTLRNVSACSCRITFSNMLPRTFVKARRKFLEFQHHISKTDYPRDYTTVRVSTSAKTWEAAGAKAFYSLNLVRGFLNLSINVRRGHSFSLGARRDPINRIILAPVHTVHETSGKLAAESYWYTDEYGGATRPFEEPIRGRFEKITEFADKMRGQVRKKKYKRDLEDAVVRYNDALDSRDWNTGYIKLWSLLELLTNTLNDSYKTTIRRASFLYKDREGARQTLSLLRDFRNDLVHRSSEKATIGVFIDDLRQFVQQLLRFLIFTKFKFRDLTEVAKFLDQSRDVEVISQKLRLINYAKAFGK